MQDTEDHRLGQKYASPNARQQGVWDLMWSRMQTNLTDSALEPYFKKTVGLHLWLEKHLILPILLFGSIDKIDSEEMKSSLAIVYDFLTNVSPEDVPSVVQNMHGFVSGSSFYVLELAQLFARLYLNFQKSHQAAFVCYTRYRVCRFSAIHPARYAGKIKWSKFLKCPLGLPALFVSQQVKLGPFTVLKYDWPSTSSLSSSTHQTNLCVALDILTGRYLENCTELVPSHWHAVLATISIPYKKKTNFTSASDISLASIIQTDRSSKLDQDDAFDSCMPRNFTISIEGGESREVRDWCVAAVFPYFATALASGLVESKLKRLELRKDFPIDLLDAIILYSEGGSNFPNLDGAPFVMTKLNPTDYEAGVEPYEEYGIHFSVASNKMMDTQKGKRR